MAKFSGGVSISLRRKSLDSMAAMVRMVPTISARENELPTTLSTISYFFAP